MPPCKVQTSQVNKRDIVSARLSFASKAEHTEELADRPMIESFMDSVKCSYLNIIQVCKGADRQTSDQHAVSK